ncbi:NnrS family protein [Thalassospira alkalitolerans]|uniref:NnrS family protein n=1 Tax=Thalassospira alkalitolerans TaxID=1293890 RepID=UPI0030EF0B40|tara:strand:- start:13148 stop:14347 length:1200 start_codon:yes stop_codon:yes gene_type:complete
MDRFYLHPLWAYAFRPFFLLAAGYAIAIIPIWLFVLFGGVDPLPWASSGLWHAHEMIYGFMVAALAGFILTALPSWTATAPLCGRGLVLLVGLWLAGRGVMIFAAILPLELVAGVNLAFLPVLCWLVTRAMMAARMRRHAGFVWAIGGLFLAQVVFFAGGFVTGGFLGDAGWGETGLRSALLLMMVLIVLSTTRIAMVVVNFALEQDGCDPTFRPAPPRRNLANFVVLLYLAVDGIFPGHAVGGWIALAAAAAQLDVLSDFHVGRVLRRPYVLGLYLGHGWIAVGFGGIGISAIWGMGLGTDFLHGLGIGAAGSAILTVMGIAGLRHSGRELRFPVALYGALVLINLSAVLRVGGSYIDFIPYDLMIGGASVLWILAFVLYLVVFVPKLLSVRADGQPG